jgi:hypothetical protein
MRLAALLLVAVLAATGTAVALGLSDDEIVVAGADPVVQRPLEARQHGQARALRTGRCSAPPEREVEDCSKQRYPRQRIVPLDARRPLRLTFSPVARVDVSFWERTRRGWRQRGARDAQRQCTDSACLSALWLPRDAQVPAGADTMRVVLYGDTVEGAEIALE